MYARSPAAVLREDVREGETRDAPIAIRVGEDNDSRAKFTVVNRLINCAVGNVLHRSKDGRVPLIFNVVKIRVWYRDVHVQELRQEVASASVRQINTIHRQLGITCVQLATFSPVCGLRANAFKRLVARVSNEEGVGGELSRQFFYQDYLFRGEATSELLEFGIDASVVVVFLAEDASHGVGRIVAVLVLGAVTYILIVVEDGFFRFLIPIMSGAIKIIRPVLMAMARLGGVGPKREFCVGWLWPMIVPLRSVFGLLVLCVLDVIFRMVNDKGTNSINKEFVYAVVGFRNCVSSRSTGFPAGLRRRNRVVK